MKINSLADYNQWQQELLQERQEKTVLICCETGCRAGGSLEVATKFEELIQAHNLPVGVKRIVKKTGCQGMCEKGPIVWIMPEGIFYCLVKEKDVPEIVERTLEKGEIVERLLYRDKDKNCTCEHHNDIDFFKKQHPLVLAHMGQIDPTDIRDYIRVNGYKAAVEILTTKDPDYVMEQIEKSNLRGRGGGGFPTGKKWRSCKELEGPRYIICNGDEGDPGAFMDRSVMEGDPHAILEGMILGAFAVGANEGYIYVRHEYPSAVEHLNIAIKQAEECGLLGDNIAGTNFSFHLRINRGGGAFVCGESSALMRSLEGKVGEPRAKYIHATEKGLFDRPTVLNNVETWANVPIILRDGAEKFRQIGTEKSPGTKVFSLVGKVKNTGLIEVAMGTTLREIIYGIGGGIINNRPFKAVQTGGPSGGCLPADKLDLPVDFDSLTKAGSMMGSGGMIVMDDRTCMVDVALYFINFLIQESCGKCAPCRDGLPQLKHLLEKITSGQGTMQDLEKIEKLASVISDSALCALGKTSPNPILSTLRYFRDEYIQHIQEKKCVAGVCTALTSFEITDNCKGCTACSHICPVNAIQGESKSKHVINQDVCIRCGSCYNVCKFDAISIEKRNK